MTRQRSFVRKISYVVAIGVLLLLLFWLSMPATVHSPGGVLAQARQEHKLHQADLGKIDPTSATMNLVMLGFNGFAVNRLWEASLDAKEREDWTTCDAALQQIKNLQPHFVKVWQYQAHNVSFNISCEFDDYRDRYHQVIKGMDMLTEGIAYNESSPHLVRDEARFIGFKIGKSDEADFFRPIFRKDKDFHARNHVPGIYDKGREQLTDNWQVSKWWYEKGDSLLESGKAAYGGLNPAIVHSDAPHSQMQYAKSLEDDGDFGDKARQAWTLADQDWKKFGAKQLRTSLGIHIKLLEHDEQLKNTRKLQEQFDKLVASEPGLRDKLTAKRRAALSDGERSALDAKPESLTPQQVALAEEARAKLRLSVRDLAQAVGAERQKEALKLADRLEAAQYRLDVLEKYRDIVNFEYWRIRCEVELLPQTLEARSHIHAGDRAYEAANLQLAMTHYNQGLAKWKEVIEKYPRLLQEKTLVLELMQVVEKYRKVLKQNGIKDLPKPFDLQAVLDAEHAMRTQDQAAAAP